MWNPKFKQHESTVPLFKIQNQQVSDQPFENKILTGLSIISLVRK